MSKEDIAQKRAEVDQRRGEIKRERRKKFRFLRNTGQLANYYSTMVRRFVKPVSQPKKSLWFRLKEWLKSFLTKFRSKV